MGPCKCSIIIYFSRNTPGSGQSKHKLQLSCLSQYFGLKGINRRCWWGKRGILNRQKKNSKCWMCQDTDTGAPDWGQLQCWFWISRKHGKIKSKFQQQLFMAHFMRIRCKNHDSGFMCLFYVFPPRNQQASVCIVYRLSIELLKS